MSEFGGYQMDRSRNVYRHNAKPEWGGAVIAWEREGKRGYQFEDGQLRVFASAHYHLLGVIDVSGDRVKKLLSFVDRARPVEPGLGLRSSDAPKLHEQVDHFLRCYPGGFAGDRWRSEHRRPASGDSLKRHRDAAIELAGQELSRARLTASLDDQREVDGVRALCRVLGATDLVSAAQLKQLAAVQPYSCRGLVAALRDLVSGDGLADARVAHWVKALTTAMRRAPVWPLATAPLALLRPQQHVCVQRSTFAAQAATMAAQMRPGQTASAPQYARLLAMCERVRECLTEGSCPPTDLFDVSDFVAFTLSQQSVEAMTSRRDEESSAH
jgi:hypothetical protein